MKVVVAHNRYSSAQPSGENSMVDNEIAQLTEAGVEVVSFQRSSDEIAQMSMPGKIALAGSPIYGRQAQQQLARLLETERPDVLHLHNPYPFLSPAVVRTAHKHGVPAVQTIHNFRHTCMSAMFFRDGKLCYDCQGKTVPLPGVRHGCYRGSRAQSAIMATTLTVHRGTWKSMDRYMALTERMAAHMRQYGIADDAIAVKPNSIPDPGPHQETGDGFLFLGRLEDAKGVRPLLRAWESQEPHSVGTLRIVGDGPLRSEVEAVQARRADVEYLGALPHDQVAAQIRRSATVLSVSLCEDTMPTVVIEALANARPVLVTNLGGPPHMIGQAGVVAEPTAESIATALPRMHQVAGDLTETARQRYLDTFSPRVVLRRHLEIYEELIAAGRSIGKS